MLLFNPSSVSTQIMIVTTVGLILTTQQNSMLTVKSFQWTSQSSLPSFRLSKNQTHRKIPSFTSPVCYPKKMVLCNRSLMNAVASTTIDPSENDSSLTAISSATTSVHGPGGFLYFSLLSILYSFFCLYLYGKKMIS